MQEKDLPIHLPLIEGGGAYDMAAFGICQFFGRYFGNLNKKWSVFEHNGDRKIQFMIENTTGTVFIQKFDYGVMVIFEKINSNTVIQKPRLRCEQRCK